MIDILGLQNKACIQYICQARASGCDKRKAPVNGQADGESARGENARHSSRYTATHPAEWAAMGIQIPPREERSTKQIQQSKTTQQIAPTEKRKEKKKEERDISLLPCNRNKAESCTKLSSNICLCIQVKTIGGVGRNTGSA